MPSVYKTLGQNALVLNTDTTTYTVPASKAVIVSTVSFCNRNVSGVNSAIRLAVVPSGESLSDKHYILFGSIVEARDTLFKTLGLTLAAGDKIVARSDTGDVSISVFGNELDA